MRYDDRSIAKNAMEQYKFLFEKRGISFVVQYAGAKLKHPSQDEISRLTIVSHIWSHGDRFWRLASKHYGDPKLWWVIAWYNQRPTENHFSRGDIVEIPLPLTKILKFLDV